VGGGSRFVSDVAMDLDSVGECLMEEVLSMQPESVRKRLIRWSICDTRSRARWPARSVVVVVDHPRAAAVHLLDGTGERV
jgi:hypothetical protein